MNCLYTTLLGTDDYVWGVIGLYRSLINTNTQYPFKAIVLDTISTDTLVLLDTAKVPYEVVEDTPFLMSGIDNRYACTLNKFQFLTWTNYDRVMFLDADIIVMENIDDLFDLETPFAAAVTTLDNNTIPWYNGYAFILPTSTILWNRLKKLTNSITITTDEKILNDLIAPHVNMSVFLEYPRLFHDGYLVNAKNEAYKYWDRFGLDTIDKINNFIDNITDYLVLVTPPENYQEIVPPVTVSTLDDLTINTEILNTPVETQYIFIRRP